MATIEAAIALGALVLVFAVVLAGLGAVVTHIRCVDAAGEAARRAARDDVAGARGLTAGLPAGSEVAVLVEGDTVLVRVAAPPLGGALRGLRVTAEAVAAREPAVAGPTGTPDGGSADGGPADGGPADGGSADGGSADGGSADGGPAEGGSAEGGSARAPGPAPPSRPVGAPEELPP